MAESQRDHAEELAAEPAPLLPAVAPSDALRLASAIGNRALARLLAPRPLPQPTRGQMESAFGADLSDVRVRESAEAQHLGAEAFTAGSDVHFAPGRFTPQTSSGRGLIAHELAHVLQQRAGRVPGPPGPGLRQHPALEAEASALGARAARGASAAVPGAPERPTGRAMAEVRQGFVVFDPAVVHGNVTNYVPNSTFRAQQKAGVSFLAGGNANVVASPAGNATRLRISQNGRLALEASDLSTRQPKYFFADVTLLPAANERLLANGSNFELVANPAETLRFRWNGNRRVLRRIDVRNLANNTNGLALAAKQRCDEIVMQVMGSAGDPLPDLGRALATPVPTTPGYVDAYAILSQYYVASDLIGGGLAGAIDLSTQLNTAAYKTHTEAVAQAYGTAMHAHRNGAPNAALDASARQLGVNEYADPDVGEGYVTFKLGETNAGNVQDRYNNRVVPGDNAHLWGFHYGGVVMKDGGDCVTLENYARNEEGGGGDFDSDPRVYFQMYGGGGQSWHEQWARVPAVAPGRTFANPLTMKIKSTAPRPADEAAYYAARARWRFANALGIADDYVGVGAVGNADQFAILLYKALAFAVDGTVGDRGPGGGSRTHRWTTALAFIAGTYPAKAAFHNHVAAQLIAAAPAKFDRDAHNQYGHNVDAVKDDYGQVAAAATAAAVADELRKGLAYANQHIAAGDSGRRKRVNRWRAAVAAAPNHAETAALKAHVTGRLAATRRGVRRW